MPGPKKGTPRAGGRQKGTPNKDKLTLRERAEALGIDPFDIMLKIANGDWKGLGYKSGEITYMTKSGIRKQDRISIDLREKAAADASEYMYAKLKSVEVTGLNGEKFEARVVIQLPDNGRDKEKK